MLAGGDHKSLYKDTPGPWTIYSTATQNHLHWVLLRHLTQNPQRELVEYRLRWVPNAKSSRWPSTFHVVCVRFICVSWPTQTQFSVEYGLKMLWHIFQSKEIVFCVCNKNNIFFFFFFYTGVVQLS